MNTHTIPPEIARRLGLDNMEPSGLEGDRRLAEVAANEATAKAIDSICDQEDEILRIRGVLRLFTMFDPKQTYRDENDAEAILGHIYAAQAALDRLDELRQAAWDSLKPEMSSEGRAAI